MAKSGSSLRQRLLASILLAAGLAHAQTESPPVPTSGPGAPPIIVGFVGGFVRHDDLRHSEAQLAERLRAAYGNRIRAAVFENRRGKQARREILRWLDADHDGQTTGRERAVARIVLYGHSWGAAAAVSLARKLHKDGIPVQLLVQVDSVAKLGQNDRHIPANVKRAANFFQRRGVPRGRAAIAAADPARTQVLGNFRLDYEKAPAECRAYPWLTRRLFRWHTAVECDPHLWSRIEALINAELLRG